MAVAASSDDSEPGEERVHSPDRFGSVSVKILRKSCSNFRFEQNHNPNFTIAKPRD